jgi:glycosyltransferase 2 family protein
LIKRLAQIGKFAVPLVIGFFIGRTIYRNWGQVRQADWQLAPLYLLISLVLTVPWFTYRPLVWKILLARFGYDLPFPVAFRVLRQAEMSRYVPGAVWQYLSRVYLAGRWGVPATASLGATMVETVLLLLAALPLAVWNLHQALPAMGGYPRIALAAFLVGSIFVVHPRILNWWAAILSRYTRQPYRELQVRWITLAGIWLSYLAMWLVLGLAVAFFVRGVMAIPAGQFPSVASGYVAAWVASMMAVIAPAGMGVRDGIFGLLLRRVMPVGAALTIALAVRLWLTVIELAWLGVAQMSPSGPAPGDNGA